MSKRKSKQTSWPSLPTLTFLAFGLGAAWKGLYVLAVFCVAATLVMTYFDAKKERAYRRVEGAGISTFGWRLGDGVIDLAFTAMGILALLIMLGVI